MYLHIKRIVFSSQMWLRREKYVRTGQKGKMEKRVTVATSWHGQ